MATVTAAAAASAPLLLLLCAQLALLLLGVAARSVPAVPADTEALSLRTAAQLGMDWGERPLLDDKLVPSHKFSNSTRRLLSSSGDCKTGNPIDDCWRCDDWQHDRQKLALCGVGYGAGARGGYGGAYYVVTDSSDDSPADPKPGTLRHAVTRDGPLWIVFHSDMGIKLSIELLVTSDKTIDGRGAHVEIANGACITVQDVSHVIIHSLKIYGCKAAGPGLVMSNTQHVGHRERSDGDGISVFTSTNIWVDHTYLADCQDGLLDCIHSSTAISITNNYFENHDKVMLLGHNDEYKDDVNMRATVAYNKFGSGLIQRLPRCRLGVFHVLNNDYTSGWGIYAVGGSADPTILSQGNVYSAGVVKEVTHREGDDWSNWVWKSSGDHFFNGAFFVQSGVGRSTAAVSLEASASVAGTTVLIDADAVIAATAYAGTF